MVSNGRCHPPSEGHSAGISPPGRDSLRGDGGGSGTAGAGIWALFDTQPAWVFTFPNNTADAVFHLSTGAIFAIVVAIQLGQDRRS